MSKAAFALVLFGVVGSLSAAQFSNGSFELGTAGTGYTPGPITSGTATGWTIVAPVAAQLVVEDITVSNPSQADGPGYQYFLGASSGNRAIGFNYAQASTGGSISQTFDTTLGKTYEVSFDYGKYGAGGGNAATLQVDVTGMLSQLFSDTDGTGYSGLGSTAAVFNKQGTFQFVATALSSTLTFKDVSQNDGNAFDLGLDNVKVTLVPEPASCSVAGLALCAFLKRRRVRERSKN